MKRSVLAVSLLMCVLVSCSSTPEQVGAPTTATATSATATSSTVPTSKVTPTTSASPSDPAKILAANQTACSAFQDQAISSGMAELMGKLSADINVSPTPAQFIRPIELFQLIEPS